MKSVKQRVNVSGIIGGIGVETPNLCPHCHQTISPNIILISPLNAYTETFAVLCTCPSCKEYIVFAYKYDGHLGSTYIPYTYNKEIEYNLPEELEFISPKFKKIYIESLTAEAYQLKKITGIGFRKSIEFLIKDYLVKFLKEPQEEISKLPLGRAIQRISSDKIKALATAAVWIGNDETHYERRFDDKDVNDMKRFVRSLAYFIASEISASDADSFING